MRILLAKAEFLDRYNRLLPKEQWAFLAGPKQLPEEEKLTLLVTEPWHLMPIRLLKWKDINGNQWKTHGNHSMSRVSYQFSSHFLDAPWAQALREQLKVDLPDKGLVLGNSKAGCERAPMAT